jgi:hypothetical protein
MAEIFLIRVEYLPPLNFNREMAKKADKICPIVLSIGRRNTTVIWLQVVFVLMKMRSRVEPRA